MAAFLLRFLSVPNLPLCEEERKWIHPVLVPNGRPGDESEELFPFRRVPGETVWETIKKSL